MNDSHEFLQSENISLCAVLESDFAEWSSWFNREEVTRFLPQGLFPWSEADQAEWFRKKVASGRFLAMVRSRRNGKLLGIASLSSINWQLRSAQASFVVPVKSDDVPLAALEARAVLTQHAMATMGLHRLWSGQVFPGNRRWTEAQTVVGWFLEGFEFDSFRKGQSLAHVARTSALAPDVLRLMELRGGSLWPGVERAIELLKRPGKAELLSKAMREIETLRNEVFETMV